MILNDEQLRRKARELALTHTPSRGSRRAAAALMDKFDADVAALREYADRLQRAGAASAPARPAEEWLLDHADFIGEQAIHIRKSFRRSEASRLPLVREGRQLRAVALCADYLEHTDGLLDAELFAAYAAAYQEIAVLTISEAALLPLFLRIAVIRRLAGLIGHVRERREAGERVDRLLEPYELMKPTPGAVREALDRAGETMPLAGPVIVRLVERLGEHADQSSDVKEWLSCRLDNERESLERIVAHEHRLQAAYEVSAGHAVQSLRLLGRLEWSGMFERLCLVDRELRKEQSGMYPLLDAASRHVLLGRVQVLARRMNVPEMLAAKQAVELADRYGTGEDSGADGSGAPRDAGQAADAGPHDGAAALPRPSCAAYYLLDPHGNRALWRAVKLCAKPRSMPRTSVSTRRTGAYFGTLFAVFLAVMAAIVWAVHPPLGIGAAEAAVAAAVVLLLALPASEWAVQAVHYAICAFCDSRPLLRYDYASGIPAEAAAMVVVPVIWSKPEQVREIAERLELHYLANRDPNLHFALLGDYADAEAETTEGDAAIAEAAERAVEALNRAYGGEGGPTFHAYIRRRTWNASERLWMGWERKRGKLVEFADLLRGGTDTTYAVRIGDASVLPSIRYVITLDADTQLPIGAAQRMIGTIHLPYNRPRLNRTGTRVVEGYGVLQPRIGISHESAMRSRFARLWSGEPGIDPYAFAVSDPYQDGMDVGIFTGKGIFDVDVFRAVLKPRIPDNRVLSHDLLEGGFLRSGFLPDIELVDGHPATFGAYQYRLHRWIRGDWQLLGWLRRHARDRDGNRTPVDLSALTRWQIVDNLRRSLLAPASFLLLAAALFLPPAAGTAVMAIVLATFAMPIWRTMAGAGRMVRRPALLGIAGGQALLTLLTLPYQTALTADAVARTLYRLAVSKRKLLEWVSSDEVERRQPRRMLGLGAGLVLTVLFGASAVLYAAPFEAVLGVAFALLWAAAPAVIDWLDRPAKQADHGLTPAERQELHALAADIWRFYEDYATERDNWLPPDNVQIDPPVGIAHRTSPTNIGMLLACAVTARDFGFIDTPGLIERLERTVATIERMDKWNGHLYNWYDTETLRPLPPLYVSTVDSGNLVGYYIAAKEGLAEWIKRDFERQPAEQPSIPPGKKRQGREEPHVAAASARGPAKLRPVTIELESSVELADPADERTAGEPRDWRIEASAELAKARPGSGGPDWAGRGRRLVERLEQLAAGTDFRPLYDPSTKLFSLGYHAASGEKETILYDLLASEARQASFIAIAMGQVPASHWFRLGRAMTKVGKDPALVSWSGTMFEYLMPPLIMRTYAGTIWDSTYRAIVRRQTEYARMRGVPMGISESGYYAFDYQMNYQYRAFGVPGLGFKRGLETDLVVAPYATIMALPYAPRTAMDELKRMDRFGARGEYGYYEAIDCTRERLPDGKPHAVVRSFMAHHQGMSLLTIGNMLLPTSMADRFHADKRVRSAELLLQERIPERPALVLHAASAPLRMQDPELRNHAPMREFQTPHTPFPEVCVLSNGSFTTVLNAAGAGFMRCDGLAVSRWREDPVADPWGPGIYVRDVEGDAVWSAAYYPAGVEPDDYEASFSLDQARFVRRDGTIRTVMDVCVLTEGNAEVRRLAIENKGGERRVLEVTTYVELSLAPPAADDAHPAFSKLFVQTEYDEAHEALLARRRPRSEKERPVWAVHGLTPCGGSLGPAEYETDRACFIGRGHGVREPQSIRTRLSGTVGAVIDPAFAARRRFTLGPGEKAELFAVTGMAYAREEALELYGRFCTSQQVERAFQLAWTRSRIELQHMHMKSTEAALCHTLASRVLYTPPLQREREEGLAANRRGQSGLWPLGISGDLPIVLVEMRDASDTAIAASVIRAHEYLRRRGIAFDAVFLNESPGGYQQDMRDAVRRLAEQTVQRMHEDRPGRVYAVNGDQLDPEERTLLYAAARYVLRADGPSLRAQLRLPEAGKPSALPLVPTGEPVDPAASPGLMASAGREELKLWNGWGGFAEDGREYRIVLPPGRNLPAPWSNVMANPSFGCLVTELGTGYTWFRNSREFKLTPWSNDPVLDPPGEGVYIRDEASGQYWSPAPAPVRGPGTVTVSHGFGYTRFERSCHGIGQTMTVYVAQHDPVKLTEVRLRNEGSRPRRLSVTVYADWVLGVKREDSAPYAATSWDGEAAVMYARNVFQETFRGETAFLALHAEGGADGPIVCTADRNEFVGRNGSTAEPAAMARRTLSGRTGTFANSCGAVQLTVDLEPGAERTVYAVLGCGRGEDESRSLAAVYAEPARCRQAYADMSAFWAATLGQTRVATPDEPMNMLLNGWLLYQALSCRMWARSAFYQAGGAYGFRDQLQDSLAVLHVRPDLTRSQILIHAEHQYKEGDVQHWWHEETGRGIRTRYSDDLLWLPYATARYIAHTGDAGVLDEVRPFLVSEELREDEHERYEATVVSDEQGTLYEHCLRAIDRAARYGAHGLPLMGIGDWNDGMNSVGDEGRGESVWLGWFLMTVLHMFADVSESRGDAARAAEMRRMFETLREAQNAHAWDGEWFRRASTDDGGWLGTNAGRECRIDAIAQSWSVISGGAPPERAQRAMQSFDRELVDRAASVAKLLTPAFDTTEPTPGYIQGYPPGIRENGGQYTHGVIWSIVAWAMLGEGGKAFELFDLMNPITHTASPGDIRTYLGEPYVMAADVYMSDPYKGRAGWTWYTGASGWMYQAGLEWVLGIRKEGGRLRLDPQIPAEWPGFTADYRFGGSVYAVTVRNRSVGRTAGEGTFTVDGVPLPSDEGFLVELVDDGSRHEIVVQL